MFPGHFEDITDAGVLDSTDFGIPVRQSLQYLHGTNTP